MYVLVVVEAETADIAERSAGTTLVVDPGSLRGVANDLQAMAAGDRPQPIHVGRLTEDINRHDGPGASRYACLD